ncbi:solute carrier family 2, facilitated glucose transporter member 11-like [Engraulis encrasicolus]|uniref:solute carrier family 2, facilitated glucose transporter member 11-like n=1 Tax=Engraulis encrasicolus TaxID=184585 RepID=UPI002FD5C768
MSYRELLGREELWPALLSTPAVLSILQLITLPWCPESPRYLLIDKGNETACDKALKQLHGEGGYLKEKAEIERERRDDAGVKPKKPWELFRDLSIRWQLASIMVINLFYQINGINAMYYYATPMFAEAGITEDKIPYVTIGTGLSEFLPSILCGILIDSLGRKVLIIGGYFLMALWCLGITLTLTFAEASPWVPYLSIAFTFAFIVSFGMGPGGVSRALTSEIFTQAVRPAACIIGLTVNWIGFFILSMVFPYTV